MVGVDAFSQALTNPLLAPRVFNEQTFSPLGHGDHRLDRAGSRTSCTATSRRAPGELPRDDDPRGLGAAALATATAGIHAASVDGIAGATRA